MLKQTKRIYSILFALIFIGSTSNLLADMDSAQEAYKNGQYEEAFKQFLAAAETGDDRAFGKVAALYLYGRGTEKDYIQSFAWFKAALDTGDRYAGRYMDTVTSVMNREQLEQATALAAERIKTLDIKPVVK